MEALNTKQEILHKGKLYQRMLIGTESVIWKQWSVEYSEFKMLPYQERRELEAEYQETKDRKIQSTVQLWLD